MVRLTCLAVECVACHDCCGWSRRRLHPAMRG
jgi:hypothetical protein